MRENMANQPQVNSRRERAKSAAKLTVSVCGIEALRAEGEKGKSAAFSQVQSKNSKNKRKTSRAFHP